MGATSGSISYTLYYVDGELPDGYLASYLDQIEEFRFRELTPQSEEEESMGWVGISDLLSTNFTRDSVFQDSYLCLSMRMDRWSLPAALFRAKYDERANAEAEKRGKRKLSRTEADALKDVMRREFKGMSLPSASMVDMVWNIEAGHVRFWSHANKKNEQFHELFESTFGVRLLGQSPYTAARALTLEKDVFTKLGDVQQEAFTQDGGR